MTQPNPRLFENVYSWYSVDWKLFPHRCQGKVPWQLAGHRPYSNLIVPPSSCYLSHSAPDPYCWAKFVSSWFEARVLQKASVDSWRVKVTVNKNGWLSMSAMDEHIQACHAIDVLLLHSALMCVAYGFRRWEKLKRDWKEIDCARERGVHLQCHPDFLQHDTIRL